MYITSFDRNRPIESSERLFKRNEEIILESRSSLPCDIPFK